MIVEDSRELDPAHPHVVRLEGRPANAEQRGAITLTDLVRQSLRMRPDRLVVGEVRGAEICDLLTAMNTGHEGGCGTVHANSAADVPARLEALAALGQLGRAALHAQLAAALDLVVHIRRHPSGRREVTELHVLVRRSGHRAGANRTGPGFRRTPDQSRSGRGRPRTDAGPMIALCVSAAALAVLLLIPASPARSLPARLAATDRRAADRSTPVGVGSRSPSSRACCWSASASLARGPGGCGGRRRRRP